MENDISPGMSDSATSKPYLGSSALALFGLGHWRGVLLTSTLNTDPLNPTHGPHTIPYTCLPPNHRS